LHYSPRQVNRLPATFGPPPLPGASGRRPWPPRSARRPWPAPRPGALVQRPGRRFGPAPWSGAQTGAP